MRRRAFLSGILASGAAARAASIPAPVASGRRRIRDLGIRIGSLPPGPWNAITDVPGVRVGHVTLVQGQGALVAGRGPIRTGVTVIVPGDDPYRENMPAAAFVMNGNGEMTGLGAVTAHGLLASPIFLTDTSNVGRVMNGAISWFLERYPEIGDTHPVPAPVVGETWGGFLHDTVGRHLDDAHVRAALNAAASGPVPEGAVGGGTAMVCYDFKGGIGTASRVLPETHGGYRVGVLAQTNHGSRDQLRVDGVPVGSEIPDLRSKRGEKSKSILLVGATDAPMIPTQLARLAKRMAFGLARTGAVSSHGSGDLLLFFSTGIRMPRGAPVAEVQVYNDEGITRAHQAAVEAAEEAILNSLSMAETMEGIDGNTAYALPLERLPKIMQKYGRPLS